LQTNPPQRLILTKICLCNCKQKPDEKLARHLSHRGKLIGQLQAGNRAARTKGLQKAQEPVIMVGILMVIHQRNETALDGGRNGQGGAGRNRALGQTAGANCLGERCWQS